MNQQQTFRPYSIFVKSFVILFLLCMVSFPSFGTGIPPFTTGKIMDTIPCNHAQGYSYALYLPSYYNTTRNWPIIYVFDPMARGSLAISNFTDACEKYGYIVVGSNNSKNGNLEKSYEAADKMFEDTWSKLQLDSSRVYTSGFSGGSRVAGSIALVTNKVSGVIGCGAGFPMLTNFKLIKSPSFLYIGLVGINDMNYIEMLELEQQLSQTPVTSSLLIFDGGHQWPSSKTLQKAVEWIELHEMKKGVCTKNDSFVQKQFQERASEAEEMDKVGNILAATRLYHSILADFQQQAEYPEIQKRVDSLENTKEFRKAKKANANLLEEEKERQRTFSHSYQIDFNKPVQNDSIQSWWKVEIRSLKKMQTHSAPGRQQMASRLLNWLVISCYELGFNAMNGNQFEKSIQFFDVLTILEPGNTYAYVQIAKANILNKDTRAALNALSKAYQQGYRNKSALKKDPVFEALQSNQRYKELLAKME